MLTRHAEAEGRLPSVFWILGDHCSRKGEPEILALVPHSESSFEAFAVNFAVNTTSPLPGCETKLSQSNVFFFFNSKYKGLYSSPLNLSFHFQLIILAFQNLDSDLVLKFLCIYS